MALDTFAKRLGTQLRPSPGDIDDADRWAIAGRSRPTPYFLGALVAALGALSAGLVGEAEAGQQSDIRFADRMRMQMRPLGSHDLRENRYAIGGRFLRQAFDIAPGAYDAEDRLRMEMRPVPGSADAVANRYAIGGRFLSTVEEPGAVDVAGAISANLGGLSASLLGTALQPATFLGRVQATLGGLEAALSGESSYRQFWDVTWALVPTWTTFAQPQVSGAIDGALGALTASFSGTALPPDARDGLLAIALGSVTAEFVGDHTPPPTRTGLVPVTLGSLQGSFRGATVPPQGNVGRISASLGGVSASFSGTFEMWSTDGLMGLQLGEVQTSIRGMFIAAGANVGRVNARLGGLQVEFRGFAAAADAGSLVGTVRVRPALEGGISVEAAIDGEPRIYPT